MRVPVPVLLLALGLFVLVQKSSALHCFTCSQISDRPDKRCPELNTDPDKWIDIEGKYEYGESAQEHIGLECVVGYSTQGEWADKVFFQGHVTVDKCEDEGYKIAISKGGIAPQIRCCNVSGCNWNRTTVLNNVHWNLLGSSNGDSTGDTTKPVATTQKPEATTKIVVASAGNNLLTWLIVAGIILVLIFIICCFCCLWRANKRKMEQEQDPYGSQAKIHDFSQQSRWADGKREVNSVTSKLDFSGRWFARDSGDSSVRGSKRIEVAEADKNGDKKGVKRTEHVKVFSERNHERYSALERKLYRNDDHVESNFNSDASTPRTGSASSDPYNAFSKKTTVDQVSREVFDNDAFRRANTNVNDRNKQKSKEDWHNIWKSETSQTKPMAMEGNVNPFRFAE